MTGDHQLHFNIDWKAVSQTNGETICMVKCRKCIGCNMATQREWSVRAFHEAQCHTRDFLDVDTKITTEIPNSSVVTLTFDEAHRNPDHLLDHKVFQRFMKRLRNYRKRKLGIDKKVSYLMCGEYGAIKPDGTPGREHFHAVLFGHSFKDLYTEQTTQNKLTTMSEELDYLWSDTLEGDYSPSKIGRASVDTFSFAGAAYVAGYVAKKSNMDGHQGPMRDYTDEHGVRRIVPISPEYRKTSTHPGLGANWLLKGENLVRVYSDDAIRISEWTFHPPKYYDQLVQRHRPELVNGIKENRFQNISKQSEEWSPDRCAAAEQIALSDLQRRRDSL